MFKQKPATGVLREPDQRQLPLSPAGHTALQPAGGVSTPTAERETLRPWRRGRMPCGMHGSEEAAPGVLLSLVREASGTRLRMSGWARTGETPRSQRI